MTAILHRYATPFITGLIVISLVSGSALFFLVGPAAFKGMLEWLSLLLILPFVLLLWKNWRLPLVYFKHLPMAIALGLSVVAALAFFVPTGSGGRSGPPQLALLRALLANPPSKIAPLVDDTTERLVERLEANGFVAAAAETPLADIAISAGKGNFELAGMLLPPKG